MKKAYAQYMMEELMPAMNASDNITELAKKVKNFNLVLKTKLPGALSLLQVSWDEYVAFVDWLQAKQLAWATQWDGIRAKDHWPGDQWPG